MRKNSISKGFDRLVPFYDLLVWVVYGSHIRKAQAYFLNRIPDHSKILILGGGTGWILKALLSDKNSCEVWYVESSSAMILKARKRDTGKNIIHFITGTEADIPEQIKFDVVITNFFLDMFSDTSNEEIARLVISILSPRSQWHVTDFVSTTVWWQKLLLKVMYTFFRFTCGIEARELPSWDAIIQQHMKINATEFFFGKFIKSAVYTL